MIAIAIHAIAAVDQLFNQIDPLADAGVIKNDGIINGCALTDVTTWPNHGGSNDGGAIFNLGHASNVDRTFYVDLVPVGGNIEPRIDARFHLDAGHLDLANITLKHTANGLPVIGDFADIHPFEFHG